ncbi:MAG: endonuclease/exonuclease/phosphatase family protein [Alphaproteobacteria bacterium]|nr:endonuclease/exonuclease/phosphatase family protein [Alphaproteobacteria bacterium]
MFEKKSRVDQSLFVVGVWVLLICSVAGFLSGISWFFDLFNHFRPQAVVVASVLALVLSFYRSWRYVLLSLAIVSLNLAVIGASILIIHDSSTIDVGPYKKTVTLISSNVLTSNPQVQAVIDMVFEHSPDIFIAVEVDGFWVQKLSALEANYPYFITHPRNDNFGMAIYSKFPFEGHFELQGFYDLPIGVADFGDFSVLAVHSPPPVSGEYSEELSSYISSLLKLARSSKVPVVMAGDFNTTLWSDFCKPILERGFMPAGPYGLAWSYPVENHLFAIQIDHIFGRDVVFEGTRTLENVGSDHYPIYSKINIPEVFVP